MVGAVVVVVVVVVVLAVRVVGVGVGVVGLGMHGSGTILQACVMSLSRMAASALKLSTKK